MLIGSAIPRPPAGRFDRNGDVRNRAY